MSNKNQINNIIKTILHLLTVIIIVWTLTPYLNRNIHITYVIPLLFLWVTLVLMLTVNLKRNLKIRKSIFYSVGWLLLIIGYRVIGFSNAALGNYFNEILFFMFLWIGIFYTNHMSNRYRKQLFNFAIIVAIINVVHNIYLLALFPNASVELNFSEIYNATNVGGTVFSIFTLLFFCLVINISINSKNIIERYIYILLGFICIIYIIQSSRATVLFFLMMTIFLFIYSKIISDKKYIENVIYSVLLFIVIFLLIVNINYLLTILINIIDNDRLEIRLEAIVNSFSGAFSENDIALSGRIELYKLSIFTFLGSINNFIFGVGYHTTTDWSIESIMLTGVGNHSEFFDLAARYGVIGIVLIYNIFNHFMKNLKKEDGNSFKDRIVFFIFMFYSFVNNTFDPSIGVIIFLMYPIYLKNRDVNIRNLKDESIIIKNE